MALTTKIFTTSFAIGRTLDLLRLITVFGLLLFFACSAFLVFEDARFNCGTKLTDEDGEAIADINWEYVTVAVLSVFSMVIFSNHIIPYKPTSWGEYLFALLAALLPAIWLPMMAGLIASPYCPDSAVLLNKGSAVVLPSGATAQTTDASVADEAGRGASLGLLLVAIGSSGLMAYIVFDIAKDPRPTEHAKKVVVALTNLMFFIVWLFYIGGAIAMSDGNNWDKDDWAINPVNNAVIKNACNDGSGAVFGRALAADNRDALKDILISAFSLAIVTIFFGALLFIANKVPQTKKLIPAPVLGIAIVVFGAMFVLVQLLVGIAISQMVYVGSNPVCAHATIGGEKISSRGLVCLVYAFAFVVFYGCAITPNFPCKVIASDQETAGVVIHDMLVHGHPPPSPHKDSTEPTTEKDTEVVVTTTTTDPAADNAPAAVEEDPNAKDDSTADKKDSAV